MDGLIKTFHIELNLLIAQIVNFGIVLFVLYKFAYKPILKVLNDRTKKIDQGLKDSETAARKLEEVTEKEKEVLLSAKKEAADIIKKSQEAAARETGEMIAKTKSQQETMLKDALAQIESEKNKMLGEIKSEMSELVVAAAEKIIGEKIDKEKDRELIEKAIK
jgi:F-type H+-transporting ATPase subunit b